MNVRSLSPAGVATLWRTDGILGQLGYRPVNPSVTKAFVSGQTARSGHLRAPAPALNPLKKSCSGYQPQYSYRP